MASGCDNALLIRYGGLAADEHLVQKRYFVQKRLYTLQIESTDDCPQDCVFCYAGGTGVGKRGLDAAEIRGLLEDAATLGIRAIDWLGGDPLTRPDWHELMLHAARLGLVNNIWTSGLPLRERTVAARVREAASRGFVSVHSDSIFPATLARLRRGGGAGSFEAIAQGVDNLLALGHPPDRIINCITFTSVQEPRDTIETMRWWFENKGVRTCLTMFNPTGEGAALHFLEPDPGAVREVYRERDRINFGDGQGTIGAMDTDKFYCGTMATVTFTGDVTPCSVIREGVGNIREARLAEIVARHGDALVHERLHDACNLPAPCDACADNDHCWGCRATAHNYCGDADGLDPKCWRIRAGEDR